MISYITRMVSFEDIRTMRLHYYDSQNTADLRFRVDIITLWIFSVCYLISINASKVSTSIMSLLGMYYAAGDMARYCYVTYIAKANETETLNQESNDIDQESDAGKTVAEGVNEGESDDVDDNEIAPEMMSNLFRKTTNSENEDENESQDKKALKQLRQFEEKIRQKNLGLDDYSDLPSLVKLDTVDWNPTNLLYYINPNLRQPGQYAASLNETDE